MGETTCRSRSKRKHKRVSIKKLKRIRKEFACMYYFLTTTYRLGFKTVEDCINKLWSTITFIDWSLRTCKNKYYVVF